MSSSGLDRRKIVQIAVVHSQEAPAAFVYALCNDGSLWTATLSSDPDYSCAWERLADIPQDDVACVRAPELSP